MGNFNPKNVSQDGQVKKKQSAHFYSKPNSKKKTALLNHICGAFTILSKKYTKGLHFIIAGDANHLKLDSSLKLRHDIISVVDIPTRLGPPAAMLVVGPYSDDPEQILSEASLSPPHRRLTRGQVGSVQTI